MFLLTPLSLSLCISHVLSLFLSPCLSTGIYLSIYLYFCLSVCPSTIFSVCLSVFPITSHTCTHKLSLSLFLSDCLYATSHCLFPSPSLCSSRPLMHVSLVSLVCRLLCWLGCPSLCILLLCLKAGLLNNHLYRI